MDLLQELNPQQRRAVTASDGPVLVLAGPGSGKTRVLTHRVAWLVLERDVAPWQIMAVTFTNKAAKEMQARLRSLLGHARAAALTLGTFHAICARILRREAETCGIPRDYVIFDADDQRTLVRQILHDLNIDDKRYRPPAVHAAISRAKNDLLMPEEYRPASYFEEIVHRVYEQYQQRLRVNGALDFDDLLAETVHLFRDCPDVAQSYQERYLHVLVDEFQDTNVAQYVLLLQLTARNRNMFAVADEDQSIYRWRGADYRNIERLRDDHPDLATHLLEQNYRSTQKILDAAQAIIRHNRGRTEKTLFTRRGSGISVVVHETYDQDHEARYVVDTIQDLVLSKQNRPGDCAVMYRTNAQSRAIEDAFIRAGIPYRLVGATRFYARREIKDMVAFLRLTHNPADSVSLSRIINVPPRAIGRKTLQTLEESAQTQGVPLWLTVEAVATESDQAPDLGARARGAVSAFYELVRGWIDTRDQITVPQLLDRILEQTSYSSYLLDGTEEGEDRWSNVQELRSVATDYAGLTLTDFLADVALVSDVDNLSDEVEAPTLLTLHSAKGLEFPIVFVTGLEEGLLPHSRSLEDPEELAEERRLLYVGMTRARDRLYLTHSSNRARFGTSDTSVPSRFLQDIPPGLVEGVRGQPVRSPTTWVGSSAEASGTARRFSSGDHVVHRKFGGGVVVESRVLGGDEEVTVVFDEAGIRRIIGSYLSHVD
jgi:DNA helicase-2/ATP-dependent DNA helicase PcrA